MNNNIDLSIVIPVYNSESTIQKVVQSLLTEFSQDISLEVLLVNDGSEDNSWFVCKELKETYNDKLLVLNLSRNFGEHNAVMAGLNFVKGKIIIIMDDDFQNPISEVKKLYEFIKINEFDVVYTYYTKKQHSFFRNLGSKFNDKVANIMLNKPKDLYLSSFKAVNYFIVENILKYKLPFPYIDGLILRVTSNIGKVEVSHSKRNNGKSGYTITKLIKLWSNMFINFSILPLRISIILGFIFSLFGFFLGVQTIIEKITNPTVPVGYSAILVAVSIFSGVQLISLGMIGEYLGRVFLSQNESPQYVIKEKKE